MDADLRDASCRPDPDFEWLTLGLCRPDLRTKIARLAAAAPVDLLFYSRMASTDTLLLVALLRIATAYPSHSDARADFTGRIPRNLVVPANPCSLGTVVVPTTGQVTMRRPSSLCGCHRYVKRSRTPYLRLTASEPDSIRCTDPVPVGWEQLRRLSPRVIGRRLVGIRFRRFSASHS